MAEPDVWGGSGRFSAANCHQEVVGSNPISRFAPRGNPFQVGLRGQPGGLKRFLPVSEGLFAEMLAEAGRDAGCWLRVLERRIQSADHPLLMAVPETLYLKCFILEIQY